MKRAADTALADIANLMKELTRLQSHLQYEVEGIGEEWEALKSVGGARADHAATYLARLQPHLAGLADFAMNCHNEITELKKNPYGDE